MITIYANWSGEAIGVGATLDEARAAMAPHPCGKDTVFGEGLIDVTAIQWEPLQMRDGALTIPPMSVVEVQGIVRLG